MHRAIKDSINVMEKSANFLLSSNKENYVDQMDGVQIFRFGESRGNFDSIPSKNTVIISNTPTSVVFYNSLAQDRCQTVFVHISEALVQVCIIVDVNPLLYKSLCLVLSTNNTRDRRTQLSHSVCYFFKLNNF